MNNLSNQLGIKNPDTGDQKVDEYLRHVLDRLDRKFKLLAEDQVTASKGIKINDWIIRQATADDVTAGDAGATSDLMMIHSVTGAEQCIESTV